MRSAELADLLARGGAVALDVREAYEWEQGHVAGSLHVPMSELARRREELPDAPIVVVCRSGNRSGVVVRALRAAGYEAHNLDGGLKAWKADGYPLEGHGRVA
jgi:rhodanese-related sulfurtransferase